MVICIRNTGTEAEDVGALDIIDSKSLEKIKSIPVKRGLLRRGIDWRWQVRSRRLPRRTIHYGL